MRRNANFNAAKAAFFASLSAVVICGSALAQQSGSRPVSVDYLNPGSRLNLPFSDAVRVGNWLILSGKIGTDKAGKLVSGGIKAETKQTTENLKSVLEANGASFDDVVKCTVMLADMKDWPDMNEVYRTYFKKDRLPARSALGANGLALGARVEIECWAVLKNAPPGKVHPNPPVDAEDRIVTTEHTIKIDGRILNYTARAGRLPILDNETGEPHGKVFFTAYTLIAAPKSAQRPLMFLWNGGPGSSSSLVHLVGFGPRRIDPTGAVMDNQETWLEYADLVFVDPIGTGYSRPTKAEYGPEFYQTRGDAEAVAEFIRVFRNRFERWDSPVFLAGESFGVIRAAGVADVLQRRGIAVQGVILLGLEMPLGEMTAPMRTALLLPSYTAAAFVHKKLGPELQKSFHEALRQAETWARTEYAQALANLENLDDEQRRTVRAQLAKFTGIPASRIDAKTLSVGKLEFARQLCADDKRVVGLYDTRRSGPLDPGEKLYDPTQDPSLKGIIDNVAVVRYFRNELQYRSDLQYQGPFGGGYPPPSKSRGDWMSVKWNFGTAKAASGATDLPLQRALKANGKMQVLVASGYYDLACSYCGNAYLANNLPPEVAHNVTAHSYAGGHAIYTDDAARSALKRDVAKFIAHALSQK